MKKFYLLLLTVGLLTQALQAQKKSKNINQKTVEASCAQCKFKVKEPQGCDLAIRVKGRIYFLDGTNLDAHGDAHEEDGFCNAIRQAVVTGTIKGNRIQVSQFNLKPLEKKSNQILTELSISQKSSVTLCSATSFPAK